MKRWLLWTLLALALACPPALAASDERGQDSARRPADITANALRDQLLLQRATQVYLWAMPLLNTLGMKTGLEQRFGAGYDIMPIWKKRLDAKTLITTPNSDVLYAMGFADLERDGPLVFEAPPGLQGVLLDVWQNPIPADGGAFYGDIGLPGPDAGKGGKYLILPPGYVGVTPPDHYVYRSATNTVFIFLRAFYQDPRDLSPAVSLLEQVRIRPLNGADAPRPMVFPDASDEALNLLPRSDAGAFDDLKQLADREGTGLADPDFLGMLAGVGIVRGQPFTPDDRTRGILDEAAQTAYAMSRAIGFQESLGGRSLRAYPDRRWIHPLADATPEHPLGPFDLGWMRHAEGYRDLDARIWYFTNYFSASPGMASSTPGQGAKYVICFTDSDGATLSGGRSYRLRLPADIPAANFWSVTLYDAANGSGLDNGQPFPSLGAHDAPRPDADGGTTLHLGPTAPTGERRNWLATVPGKDYFAVLRLYGPTRAALDKTWKPGDIEPAR